MKRPPRLERDLVVVQAALVCEGLLLITAFVFSALFDIPLVASFSPFLLVIGIAASFPLLGGNILFSRYASRHPDRFPRYSKFSKELIEPLCQELPLPAAFVVAVLSGLCEELFFRGIMQSFLGETIGVVAGFVVLNGLFALIHFIGRIKDFWTLIPFYFFCGIYFSAITFATADLTSSIVAHGLNNFVAVLYVRSEIARRKKAQSVT